MGLVVNVKEGQFGLNLVVHKWDFWICQVQRYLLQKCLTSRMRGLAWMYHLRSNSGSNGPIAKESHRFLVAGPFKFDWKDNYGRHGSSTISPSLCAAASRILSAHTKIGSSDPEVVRNIKYPASWTASYALSA